MIEIWKDVVGLEKYAKISSLGKVISKERIVRYEKYDKTIKEYIKKGTDNGLGYIQYKFQIDGKIVRKYAHVMVAEAFLGENKNMEVNHIDGNKKNNSLENLEWVSHSDNMKHAIKEGLLPVKEKTYYKKICETCEKFFKSEDKRRKHCSTECARLSDRKVKNRPTKEELEKLIRESSFASVGRKYGISDNSVRKWCELYGLPKKASYYK